MATLAIDINQLNPSDLLRKIQHGDTVWLTCNGQTVATVNPTVSQQTPAKGEQLGSIRIGTMQGQFTVSEDFDAPLPNDLLNAFEGQHK
ncbi:MAG: hypothetical protein VXW65_07415 [Pseudomonadota bacterium]|nr:hypothetical protein [Pseudomonadota bacterium]